MIKQALLLISIVALSGNFLPVFDLPILPPEKTFAQGKGVGEAHTFEAKGYRFELKPPADYQFQAQDGPMSSKALAWVGKPREDGVRPYVMVTVMSLPGPPDGHLELATVLDKFIAGIKNRRNEWKQSAARKEEINGLSFLRVDWEGTESTLEVKMHGFNLVAFDGSFIVQLSSQDVEPHHTKGLQVAEAVIRTFRSKQQQ